LKPYEHFKRPSRKRSRFFINGERYVPVVAKIEIAWGLGARVLLREHSVSYFTDVQVFISTLFAVTAGAHYSPALSRKGRQRNDKHLDDFRIRKSVCAICCFLTLSVYYRPSSTNT